MGLNSFIFPTRLVHQSKINNEETDLKSRYVEVKYNTFSFKAEVHNLSCDTYNNCLTCNNTLWREGAKITVAKYNRPTNAYQTSTWLPNTTVNSCRIFIYSIMHRILHIFSIHCCNVHVIKQKAEKFIDNFFRNYNAI